MQSSSRLTEEEPVDELDVGLVIAPIDSRDDQEPVESLLGTDLLELL